MTAAANTVDNLIVDLIEWVSLRERTYDETIEAWRTSCPRLPVWEEANDRGLIKRIREDGVAWIRVTPAGERFRASHHGR